MPHAVGQDDSFEEDDNTLDKLLQEAAEGGNGSFNLDELNDRPLEVGEKAEDAVDFMDIGDDDLAEDEDELDENDGQDLSGTTIQDFSGPSFEHDDDLDELFGDGLPSSPVQERSQHDHVLATSIDMQPPGQSKISGADTATTLRDSGDRAQPTFREVRYRVEDEDDDDPEWREQMALFQAAGKKRDRDHVPAPPEDSREYFAQTWPDFEPGKPPRFSSLIPRKRAFFVPKTPLKPPKSIQPNKVNLDIAADQERSFRLPSTTATTKAGRQLEAEQRGIVYITDGIEDDSASSDEMEVDDLEQENDQEMIGNVSWNDLKIACEDWEISSSNSESDGDEVPRPPDAFANQYDWIQHLVAPPKKKRRLGDWMNPIQFSIYDHMAFPSWDDPELVTAKLSKKIVLDMNDPHLLLDIQQPNAEQKKLRSTGLEFKRDNRGSLANPMFKRYNISNDDAYDALKENHQHKVRSTLGHMSVEHSLPALKLQYPFYKVALSDRELRSFHRPTLNFKPGERAHPIPLKHIKKKYKKNLKPQEAYQKAEDLSVGDNSDLLLAEYSEEYPTTLSNFGMGNKIVNYYRRKDNEDTSRPKLDLGETAVLLPQDKSPFSLFGTVEPGQTVPALHNAMYRAPVFRHNPKPTDFLVSKSHTGVEGSKYYIRNLQNLVVVGQEFPSVEVPGVHARKVTEASKKRLKMLSFRLWRKGQQRNAKGPWVSNEMIKHHLPGTEIAQNRSRMREIMSYDKDRGTWNPKDGEVVPEEATLRTWIKPEDVCLIDSMHAGDKHLMDAGFKTERLKEDEDADDGEKLELKLAPWHTTKNFLNACQGKAMLELHGEGDPTGRGEAFSFIKVSMKGGFKDVGESATDKLDAKKNKELGGHSYNVAQQQRRYEEAIQRIWTKQTESLSSTMEHSDVEMDDDSIDPRQNAPRGRTPRSEFGTPAGLYRDDDTTSQFSRNSNNDVRGKILRIKRYVKNKYDEYEQQIVTITDPEVVRLYNKRKKTERLMNMKIDEIKPTGNAEFDAQQQLKLKAELARLTRNVERREGREKLKNAVQGSTPGTPASSLANGAKNSGATVRKCANCGEVGHIKTNKKLCPLLNGQRKQSDTFKDAAASPVTVAATPTVATPQLATSPK
ncbi:hypothetical protein K469DRAFT_700056 [Zopfia rhizophila CBS 207.26]|uniref:Transcription initiation factor TFIID subunit 1 histone acetyltransferase domain-containing protein n=1 Tax=Zopfia rhizophila CBS 207.26 TaxID=1314779 RepID=A0A6A6DA50_9PEZI|nr:hypothetical protein K469DRAFT_700056 [Zopfia rhizophila CBS 207.26]